MLKSFAFITVMSISAISFGQKTADNKCEFFGTVDDFVVHCNPNPIWITHKMGRMIQTVGGGIEMRGKINSVQQNLQIINDRNGFVYGFDKVNPFIEFTIELSDNTKHTFKFDKKRIGSEDEFTRFNLRVKR